MDSKRKYRPPSEVESRYFSDRWCSRCIHDRPFRTDVEHSGCPILLATFRYQVDDPEYPSQWTCNDAGEPICTAFEPDAEADPRE